MYVLHHADQPSLYNDLPNEPTISPLVSLWKGVTKPLALLGMGAAVLAGFFHYTRSARFASRKRTTRPSSASPWCIRSILRCMWSIPRSRDPDRAAPFAGPPSVSARSRSQR